MDNPAATIPSISPRPAVQPEVFSPVESPNRRWLLWSAAGFFMLIIGIAIGVFSAKFFSESQRQTQLTSTPTLIPSLISTPTLDPTANRVPDGDLVSWKTFLAPSLKLEFQLPLKLYTNHKSEYGKGGFQEYILPGETGTMVCLTNKKLEPIINNPGANDCRYDIFVISALSIDYTAGRGGSFLNNRGYTKIAGKYFNYKRNGEFHPELIQEIKNPNGVEILKIRGGPLTGLHDGRNPYTGKIGALINTSINNYPGFAILMILKPEEGLTEEIFDQILSTFKFLD